MHTIQIADSERRIGNFIVGYGLFEEVRNCMEIGLKRAVADEAVVEFLKANGPLTGSIVGYDEVETTARSEIWEKLS